jgi:hypothetical protein
LEVLVPTVLLLNLEGRGGAMDIVLSLLDIEIAGRIML